MRSWRSPPGKMTIRSRDNSAGPLNEHSPLFGGGYVLEGRVARAFRDALLRPKLISEFLQVRL